MNKIKLARALVWMGCLWAGTAFARSVVTIVVDDRPDNKVIPADFIGLSFETLITEPDGSGKIFFNYTNKPLVALFHTLGVGSLRIGGNTADLPADPMPKPSDIDNLFAFAREAGVKVIYTLRLRNGSPAEDAAAAKYIEEHYRDRLACFAIGNEPEFYKKVYPVLSNYSAFSGEWRKFAEAVSEAAPGAKFCGPCAGERTEWSRDFANDFANSHLVSLITQHDYPGGSSRRVTNAAAARDQMLSSAWLDHYRKFYNGFATTALSNNLPFRLEEANNFSDGGVKNASDTFAAALWSLDYLHWWAARGASGVNIHGRRWLANCVIHPVLSEQADGELVGNKNYNVRPIGYGLKAFALGGHGRIQPLTTANPEGVNLSAYAARDGRNLYVTIINKSHGNDAKVTEVSIVANGISKAASAIFLTAPDSDVAARTGVTLGGASIEDDGSWHGQWSALNSVRANCCKVDVPAATAAIVKIEAETE